MMNGKLYCHKVNSITVALYFFLASSSLLTKYSDAHDYFNPALLELSSPEQIPADLSAFESNGGQLEGAYLVDIYVNNKKVSKRDVEFRIKKTPNDKEMLQPCISLSELESWGVLINKFPDLSINGADCADIQNIPQAKADFQFNKQQLLLSFPQSSIKNSARELVDPNQWDNGINSFLINYSLSGSNNYSKEKNNINNQYLNIRPGLNLGAWRFRNYTTFIRNSSSGSSNQKWDSIYNYAQRGINTISGLLTLGDSSTPADVFDSISFRGVQLASDDEMLPDSMKGYAPVVRGIARSNAEVTIRQNGYIIYQTYVFAGSFEITDMYPTGGAGDLYVTIKESDGSEQHLIVPYASLPILQREGRLKYSATVGEYRTYNSNVDKPLISQLTAIYGLPWGTTLYGGGQVSKNYSSLSIGQGQNMGGLGALSVDVTQAWATLKDAKSASGQSWRIRYSKNIAETGTNFAIAGYKYSTSGYWSMQEALETYTEHAFLTRERRKNRTELTLNQNLWEKAGNIVLSAVSESYWDSQRRMDSIGVGYNNTYNDISYSINYTYNQNSYKGYSVDSIGKSKHYVRDQLVSLNVSIPLRKFTENNTYISYSMNSSKNSNTVNNVNIGGTLLENNNLSWGLQENYGSSGAGNSFSANGNWRATYGEISGGYTRDSGSQRVNYMVQGGILAHEGGITLGQPMSETVALIAAPGVTGASILNQTGVKTDFRGYAIVPYVNPYKHNTLSINPETLDSKTDLTLTTQTVVPTRGAVVKASYQASVGYRALASITMKNGFPIPFGTIVTIKDETHSREFITGDSGEVYLTGLQKTGSLHAKWGSTQEEQCNINYSIATENNAIASIVAHCI